MLQQVGERRSCFFQGGSAPERSLEAGQKVTASAKAAA